MNKYERISLHINRLQNEINTLNIIYKSKVDSMEDRDEVLNLLHECYEIAENIKTISTTLSDLFDRAEDDCQ